MRCPVGKTSPFALGQAARHPELAGVEVVVGLDVEGDGPEEAIALVAGVLAGRVGQLTHEQWIQLNLRHAELHLSFLLPE